MDTHIKNILTIEGCDNPSCVQSVVEKNGENNQKVGKIGQVVSYAFAPRPEHDTIWTWWKGYDSVDAPRWNFEVEQFVVW